MTDIEETDTMRDEYDFDHMQVRRNPYASRLKKQITLDVPDSTIDYFTQEARKEGVSYQSLMSLCLVEWAAGKRHANP